MVLTSGGSGWKRIWPEGLIAGRQCITQATMDITWVAREEVRLERSFLMVLKSGGSGADESDQTDDRPIAGRQCITRATIDMLSKWIHVLCK